MDGKDQKYAIEQPRENDLHHRIIICLHSDLRKTQIKLVGVVFKPRPRSSMEFANDDDDIYESEHRLKVTWHKMHFGTIINIKHYFINLLYYRYKSE